MEFFVSLIFLRAFGGLKNVENVFSIFPISIEIFMKESLKILTSMVNLTQLSCGSGGEEKTFLKMTQELVKRLSSVFGFRVFENLTCGTPSELSSDS